MSDEPTFDPIVTPYSGALEAAVERLYEFFGKGHVSKQFEVCQCPVCMNEETRQEIIATRTDIMPNALICAYSNSAHGVPNNLEDLKLLLPRYLDWIAQDELVDDVGVGSELLRFGDAKHRNPGLFTDAQQAALDHWAEQVMWHFGTAEALGLDNIHTPQGLIEMLLVGGWDVDLIIGNMEKMIADPHIGQAVLLNFLQLLQRRLNTDKTPPRIDWFAMRYVAEEVRAGVAEWLNSGGLHTALETLATDPDADPHDQTYARILMTQQGRFTAQSFPYEQKR